MRIKYLFAGLSLFLVLLASSLAADISGQWKAQAQGADITITFKMDGTTLTGTLDNSLAGSTEIKEGRIEEDAISFYVVRKIGESDTKITWKGKVAGDEIKFTREALGGMGGATEIIAKRIK
jgi:hypothetical protein